MIDNDVNMHKFIPLAGLDQIEAEIETIIENVPDIRPFESIEAVQYTKGFIDGLGSALDLIEKHKAENMIQALFPDIKIYAYDAPYKIIYTGIDYEKMVGVNIDATRDWWNALYKRKFGECKTEGTRNE